MPAERSFQLDDTEQATILAALYFNHKSGQGEPENRRDDIHLLATADGNVISLDQSDIWDLTVKFDVDNAIDDIAECTNI